MTGQELRVEVKGASGDGDQIVLTRNEVDNAKIFDVALFLVSGIKIVDTDFGRKAEGGTVLNLNPWILQEENLIPLSFVYNVDREPDTES